MVQTITLIAKHVGGFGICNIVNESYGKKKWNKCKYYWFDRVYKLRNCVKIYPTSPIKQRPLWQGVMKKHEHHTHVHHFLNWFVSPLTSLSTFLTPQKFPNSVSLKKTLRFLIWNILLKIKTPCVLKYVFYKCGRYQNKDWHIWLHLCHFEALHEQLNPNQFLVGKLDWL